MEKEYRKLTADQFRRAIGQLPEVKASVRELPELLRTASSQKIREALQSGVYWAALYELPLVQHAAFGLYLLGQGDKLVEIAKAADPQGAMLQHMQGGELEGKGPDEADLDLGTVLAVVVSFQRTVFSIMLYKRSISALVAEVREGNDDSLFLAVRVDRAALTCPTIAQRIAKAELLGEKKFFERLRSALKGPSKKHWEFYSDLRYSLVLLRELGMDSMSDAELEHLLVDVLQVYPKTWSARKNLRKQYYESKRIKRL
ncbi:hypothetical protein AYO46_00745 [Betaproteobacteria bacterium SCGC AG-212-J23]|nr:hypothetical protein AYO46_00745 [Betaproteobacteria bacterium SCGC AG-212-J23]